MEFLILIVSVVVFFLGLVVIGCMNSARKSSRLEERMENEEEL